MFGKGNIQGCASMYTCHAYVWVMWYMFYMSNMFEHTRIVRLIFSSGDHLWAVLEGVRCAEGIDDVIHVSLHLHFIDIWWYALQEDSWQASICMWLFALRFSSNCHILHGMPHNICCKPGRMRHACNLQPWCACKMTLTLVKRQGRLALVRNNVLFGLTNCRLAMHGM